MHFPRLFQDKKDVGLMFVWILLLFITSTKSAFASNVPNISSDKVAPNIKTYSVQELCEKIDEKFKKLQWGKSSCSQIPWKVTHVSEHGWPLIFADFGKSANTTNSETHIETTLLLGGVHPDELPPVAVAFRLAKLLNEKPELLNNARLVIAPLVNTDGFLTSPIRRTNANGVDLNRNFPTRDWEIGALRLWREKRKKDPNFFPGNKPGSEAGTKFQISLLDSLQPDKVISMHAPLAFLDYDGPGDGKKSNTLSNEESKAKEIAKELSKESGNFRIIDYQFYPGSLGNMSGNEYQIPTLTLEMESKGSRFVEPYWRKFLPGLLAATKYEFHRKVFAKKSVEN